MANSPSKEVNNLPAETTDLTAVLRNAYLSGPRGVLIICGETGRIIDTNPAALAILNCTPQQVLDHSLAELTPFRDLPELDEVLQRLNQTGCATFEEVPVASKKGRPDFVDVTLHSYLVNSHRFIECNLQIVTTRKRRHARERRRDTMAALAHMAEQLARELNGLLPVISASSDLALGPGALVQHSYKALEEVQRARGRLALLARGLSAFSGGQNLQIEAVDLNHQLASLDVRLCEVLGDRVRLIQQLTPDLPPAKTDPVQLRFVILTLAAFARRRMSQGGTLHVSTNVVEADDTVLRGLSAAPGRYLRLTLEDSGEMLDDRTWAHLFEPFDGGDENGLAMAAAYGIVKQSGGYVSASANDAGTTFSLYLRSAEHSVPALAGRRPDPARAGGETVVLFQAEEGLRHVVRNLLTRKGYRILEAEDEDGVRRLFADPNHAIELLIANLSASTLAYNMVLAHPRLKLVYISEFSDDAAGDHPGPLPPDAAVLQKPFRLDALLVKIRSVLDNKSSAR